MPALEQAALLNLGVALGAAALRTDEPTRPASSEQRLGALRLTAVGGEEPGQAQSRLESHAVLVHRSAPVGWTRGQRQPARGSRREPAESRG